MENTKVGIRDVMVDKEKQEEETEGQELETDAEAEASNEEETSVVDEDGTDEDDQVIFTKKEADELRKKADECDSLLDKLLRTRADFVNYQKRMGKESKSISQYAVQELILDLLPELDNVERAVKLAENPKDIEKFVEGIKLIGDQLLKVLGKHGVKPIETVDKPFDPNLHEAVFEEENNELPHHTVIEEFQRGYLLKERAIRPAKVKVSKRTIDEEETKEEVKEETDSKDEDITES